MKNGFSPERAMAAAAHGVDLSVNIDKDLGGLELADGLQENVRSFLEDALQKRNVIGYLNALEQVKRMLEDAEVNVQVLASSTYDQVAAVLDGYRSKPPYADGAVLRRI